MVQLCDLVRICYLPITLRVPFSEYANLQSPRDPTLTQIVRSQFDGDTVSGHNTNEVLSHLARNVRYYTMAIFELYSEASTRKGLYYSARKFYHFLIYCHTDNSSSL